MKRKKKKNDLDKPDVVEKKKLPRYPPPPEVGEYCSNCQKKSTRNRLFVYIEDEKLDFAPAYDIETFCTKKCAQWFWRILLEPYTDLNYKKIELISFKKWDVPSNIQKEWEKNSDS